jgi:hypothetical protein
MAIPDLQRKQIERALDDYCNDVPDRVRHLLRYVYEIGPNSVELFEERPPWDGRGTEWMRHPIAKFRYVAKREVWELFCVYRDLKWHRYEPLPSAGRFQLLLDEVERDPTCIFWG